jgi:hypothetical protein
MMKKLLYLLLILPIIGYTQVTLISEGSSGWSYLDDGSNPNNPNVVWNKAYFVPGGNWKTNGKAPFIYNGQLGPGCPAGYTCIDFGPEQNNRYITSYYRKTFDIPETSTLYQYLELKLKRDDGAIVYINGQEVYKTNIGENHYIGYRTLADSSSSDNGYVWRKNLIDGHILKSGSNTITVELHQSSIGSLDLYFDLELIAHKAVAVSHRTIVPSFDNWKYFEPDTDLDTLWRYNSFDDSAWPEGNAELGYGDGDETTIVGYGGNPSAKKMTNYFRKAFSTTAQYDTLKIRTKRDDGIIIHLDGKEVFRDHMKLPGKISYSDTAFVADDDGEEWISTMISGLKLPPGNHLLAVEVHQQSPGSSDLSFNFELIGLNEESSFIDRGPYLMKGSPTSIQIRWQTNNMTNSQVKIGTNPLSLTTAYNNGTISKDHIVNVSGLQPSTKYFYSVGNSEKILQATSDNYFITPPVNGEIERVNILTMGDFGNGDQFQRKVMETFETYIQDKYIHVFLPLGDMAYKESGDTPSDGGTLSNFQNNFFQMYQNDRIMKQTPIYPNAGNHEYYNYQNTNIDLTNFNRPYAALFNMPTAGEEGGVASGTERYYSFNKANIHFVVLDPYGWDEYPEGEYNDTLYPPPHISTGGRHAYIWENNNIQKNWLISDLSANTQQWTIISIHAPIYSKGNHDTDDADNEKDWNLRLIRQHLLPIFEQYDVDLVLSGHSHVYERSKLLRGHYGTSDTYNSALYPSGNVVNNSSGKHTSNLDCPYMKSKESTNHGIVYAVVGTGAETDIGSPEWPHSAMPYHNKDFTGSMLIEIEGNQMNVRWIADDGQVKDNFSMMKDAGVIKNLIIQENDLLTLQASWSLGPYSWSGGGGINREFSPTPPPGLVTSYTVTDGYGCITDTYNIRVIPVNCLSETSYSVDYEILPPSVLKYETGATIQANKSIKPGTNIKFDAGHSISLEPGFSAEGGSVFRAYIDGCGND